MQKFGTRIREDVKRFWSVMKEDRGAVILAGVMTLISVGMVAAKLVDCGVSVHSKRAILTFALLILVTIGVGLILYRAKVRKWRIEKVFLVLGLTLGMLYVVIVPMTAQQDEGGHFARAYEIAEGNLLSREGGSHIPYNVMAVSRMGAPENLNYAMILQWSTLKDEGNYQDDFNYVDGYAVFNYVPQVIGIWIGKFLDLALLPTMYICRMLNLICCVAIIYLCIKYIPIMKELVFLIAMFPRAMNLFASTSADGLIICAGLALVTFVLYTRKTMKRKLKTHEFWLLALICLTLVVTKPIYAFMCFLVFWIPKERFKSNKQKIWSILLLGGVTLGCVLLRMILTPVMVDEEGARALHEAILAENPGFVLWTAFRTLIDYLPLYIGWMIGQDLEWGALDVYSIYIVMLFALLVLVLFQREDKVPKSLRLFSVGTFTATTIAILLSEYLIWTPAESKWIIGVDGRYFLPVLPLIGLALMPSKGKPDKRKLVRPEYLYIMMALTNVYTMFVTMASHLL